MLLAERDNIIKKNNYVSNELCTFEIFGVPNNSELTYDNHLLSSRSIMAEYKMNIDEGIDLLNDKLVNIESTVNTLEKQHAK